MKYKCVKCGNVTENSTTEIVSLVIAITLAATILVWLYPPEYKITQYPKIENASILYANSWGILSNATFDNIGRAQHCFKEYDDKFDLTMYRCEFDGDIYTHNFTKRERMRLRFWCDTDNVCGILLSTLIGEYKTY